MAIIDPDGLFYGERLSRCSDMAQLFWPRFLLAANGCGRVNLDYGRLCSGPLKSLHKQPTRKQVIEWFKEYQREYLAFIYEFNGELWAQWDVPARLLSKYQTAADKRSPGPPQDTYERWQAEYREAKRSRAVDLMDYEVVHTTTVEPTISENSKNLPEISENSPLGIGIGEGIGKGKGKSYCAEPSSTQPPAEPPVVLLPLNTGTEYPISMEQLTEWKHLYPAVDVMQSLRDMRGWLIANPNRRKTQAGIVRFVNAWLAKEQDRGGIRGLEAVNGNVQRSIGSKAERDRETIRRTAERVAQSHG